PPTLMYCANPLAVTMVKRSVMKRDLVIRNNVSGYPGYEDRDHLHASKTIFFVLKYGSFLWLEGDSGLQGGEDIFHGYFLLVDTLHIPERQHSAFHFFRSNDEGIGNGFAVGVVQLLLELSGVGIYFCSDARLPQ